MAEAVVLDSARPEGFVLTPGLGVMVNGVKGRTVNGPVAFRNLRVGRLQ